ncbi:Uncharacterised protein [Mycobacterium tuberculosis]|nr:Uncharacterised protein [Mycobacterium tuberculosis]
MLKFKLSLLKCVTWKHVSKVFNKLHKKKSVKNNKSYMLLLSKK